MKLEVGMYVRTDNGQIYKLTQEIEGTQDTICIENIDVLKELNTITKSSHNIIDLIEVGDYVNGYRVDRIETFHKGSEIETKSIISLMNTHDGFRRVYTSQMLNSTRNTYCYV